MHYLLCFTEIHAEISAREWKQVVDGLKITELLKSNSKAYAARLANLRLLRKGG